MLSALSAWLVSVKLYCGHRSSGDLIKIEILIPQVWVELEGFYFQQTILGGDANFVPGTTLGMVRFWLLGWI